jgi:hypothetical protein
MAASDDGATPMLGRTDLRVPRLGMGVMVWGDMSTAPRWNPARNAYGPTSSPRDPRLGDKSQDQPVGHHQHGHRGIPAANPYVWVMVSWRRLARRSRVTQREAAELGLMLG